MKIQAAWLSAALVAGAFAASCSSSQNGSTTADGGSSSSGGSGSGGSSSSLIAISVGESLDCALLSGGTVECSISSLTTPVAVSGLSGATAISAGFLSICALLSGGTVECWGNNEYGELGNGTTTSSSTPVAVSGL